MCTSYSTIQRLGMKHQELNFSIFLMIQFQRGEKEFPATFFLSLFLSLTHIFFTFPSLSMPPSLYATHTG